MGRTRTPTAILDAKGGFLTHKNRQRPNEPMADRPIGAPPKYLNAAEKKVWKELVSQSAPGVLMISDTIMLSVFVRLSTKFQLRQPMMAAETAQMITLSSKFAMNPADRSKVEVEKPKSSSLSLFLADRKPTPIDRLAS